MSKENDLSQKFFQSQQQNIDLNAQILELKNKVQQLNFELEKKDQELVQKETQKNEEKAKLQQEMEQFKLGLTAKLQNEEKIRKDAEESISKLKN